MVYYKRLETGRFSPRLFVPGEHAGFRWICWDELVLFMEGISPGARRRKRFQAGETKDENNGEYKEKTVPKVWLTR